MKLMINQITIKLYLSNHYLDKISQNETTFNIYIFILLNVNIHHDQ